MLRDVHDLSARAATMKAHEHTGDELTAQLFTLLHQTGIPLLSPDVIQSLTSALDDTMDAFNKVAELLVTYRIDRSRQEAIEAGSLLVQAAQELATAMPLLRRRADRPGLQKYIAEVHRLESEVARVVRAGLAAVIAEHEPFDLICWKDIYAQLASAAGHCEDVADNFDAVMIM